MARAGNLSRRDFVALGAGAAAAGLVGGAAHGGDPAFDRRRVVLVRDPDAVAADGAIRAEVVTRMLDRGVAALLGVTDAAAAWSSLVAPGDVVGVKSNTWRNLPTPACLEAAIRDSLVRAGVGPADVAVDDKRVRSNPVFLRSTALVNVRPMRTHHWSGLGSCIKNYIMFAERPPDYHADACATLGAVWHLPQVRGKTRLNVLVLLTPQFHGVGPHGWSPEYVWPYCGLALGFDPVPVDATGARVIQAKRREHFGGESPIAPSPHHIELAGTRYGLGEHDSARIELLRLGWDEKALI